MYAKAKTKHTACTACTARCSGTSCDAGGCEHDRRICGCCAFIQRVGRASLQGGHCAAAFITDRDGGSFDCRAFCRAYFGCFASKKGAALRPFDRNRLLCNFVDRCAYPGANRVFRFIGHQRGGVALLRCGWRPVWDRTARPSPSSSVKKRALLSCQGSAFRFKALFSCQTARKGAQAL